MTDLRDRIAAFLSVWHPPTAAQLDMWEAVMEPVADRFHEAAALWLRGSGEKPRPSDIYALAAEPMDDTRMRDICVACAVEAGVTLADLRGPSREARYVRPRQRAMAMMQRAGFSLPQIGRYLGGRDHTTVLHGVRRHAARLAEAEETETAS